MSTPLKPISPPKGFKLVKRSERIAPGDLVSDDLGRWRGPITQASEVVGLCADELSWAAQACRPTKP
jgi:hypothetical protein